MRIMWLTNPGLEPSPDRLHYLKQNGHEVTLLASSEVLTQTQSYTWQRPHVMIIADQGQVDTNQKLFLKLGTFRSLQGTKFIFSSRFFFAQDLEYCAWLGFRDVIDDLLPADLWLQRFITSTASHCYLFKQPTPQLWLEEPLQLSIPARISWLSNSQVCLETHIKPKVGDKIHIKSPFLKQAGLRNVAVTVNECRQHQLLYRFSGAVVCSWPETPATSSAIKTAISQIKVSSELWRIYAICRTSKLRQALEQQLQRDDIALQFALEKKNLPYELRFFSPTLILVEAAFIDAAFQAAVTDLPFVTRIVVLGKATDAITALFPSTELTYLSSTDQLNLSLPGWLKPQTHGKDQRHYINPSDPSSYGSVLFTGQLERLHPQLITVKTAMLITNYALLQVNSPRIKAMFNHKIWLKLLMTQSHDQQYQYSAWPTGVSHVENNQFRQNLKQLSFQFNESILADFFKLNSEVLTVDLTPPAPEAIPASKARATVSVPSDRRQLPILYLLIFIVFTALSLWMISVYVPIIAAHFEKSGGVYRNQLEIYKEQHKIQHTAPAEATP